ncbi:MAG: ATP/GTP-binding protein [Armatimonadetes bacterium]|nr:ATP/GTP-binding protein [Armatimonadota bacterium]
MLIQFSVENFLSFQKRTILSLVATNDAAHPTHLIEHPSVKARRLVRAIALYGANASGKSNLIKAMKFAQNLIVKGTPSRESIPFTPFKLGSSQNLPSRFQFVFLSRGVEYIYGFAVNASRIVEEFLYAKPNGKEVKYFERITSENLKTEVDTGAILSKTKEIRQFLKYKEADTRPNQLFLTAIFDGNIHNRTPELSPVVEWFQMVLTIIDADAQILQLPQLIHVREGLSPYLSHFLSSIDTGICEVFVKEITWVWDRYMPGVSLEKREEILQALQNIAPPDTDAGEVRRVLTIEDADLTFNLYENEKGELRLLKLLLKHEGEEGKLVDFELEEESDGTQRMIHLAPLLPDIYAENERVIVIDELDRALHPHISRLFIQTALQKPLPSQLLFTTHDTNLLDSDLLRRDEIRFVEKERGGNSQIYSLAEFKIRPDLQIEKGYLNGRFGAIPFIGDINQLGWKDAPDAESAHA